MPGSETTFLLMAIAVLISSVALLASALASVGTYRAIRRLEGHIAPLVPQTQELLASSKRTLDEARKQLRESGDKVQTVLDDVHAEVQRFAETRADITLQVQSQVQRLGLILDDSLSQVREVVTVLHDGVLRPVREVNGMFAGVATAVRSFMRGKRPTPDKAAQDEEIFIG